MSITITTPADAPTVEFPAVEQPAPWEVMLREKLHEIEVTAVRLADEREALRRDRDALLTVSLDLQRALDAAAVRETALRAEADGHAAHVRELLEERRLWLWCKARLEAVIADLQRPSEADAVRPKGRRRGTR
jgi:hypothetical protein